MFGLLGIVKQKDETPKRLQWTSSFWESFPLFMVNLSQGRYLVKVRRLSKHGRQSVDRSRWSALTRAIVSTSLCGAASWAWGAERATVVAISGQAASGAPGTTFDVFGIPVINDVGQVAFTAAVHGSAVTYQNRGGVWMGWPGALSIVARSGDPAPGTDYKYGNDGDPLPIAPTGLSNTGQIAFSYGVLRPDTPRGNFFGTPGSIQKVALRGDSYPAPYKGTWATPRTSLSDTGQLLVHDSNLVSSVWTGTSIASLTRVISTSDPVPGLPTARGIDPAYFGAALNSAGAFEVTVGIRDAGNNFAGLAILGGTSVASITKVAYEGDPVPSLGSYKLKRIIRGAPLNSAGQLLFETRLDNPNGPGNAVWRTDVNGSPVQKVAFSSDPAPGSPPGVTLGSVDNSVLAGDGSVFFTAPLDQGGSSPNDSSVWHVTQNKLTRVFDSFSSVRGAPLGTTASRFYDYLVTNSVGQLAFRTSLKPPGGIGVDAIIGYDSSLGANVLARVGDSIEVAPGDVRTLAGIGKQYLGTNGEDSLAPALNDQGVYAYQATFTDNTQAILTTRIPVAGDTNYDGIVDNSDLKTFLAHFNTGGARAEGDFNSDGLVGFDDFQLLERNFGHHPPGVPTPVVDLQELGLAAQSVPEPGFGFLLAGAVLGARRRRSAGSRG